MSLDVQTNISSLMAQNNLVTTTKMLSQAFIQLSTGYNLPVDDSQGLQISGGKGLQISDFSSHSTAAATFGAASLAPVLTSLHTASASGAASAFAGSSGGSSGGPPQLQLLG